MSTGAEFGHYFVQPHNSNFFPKIQWGCKQPQPLPSGYASALFGITTRSHKILNTGH